MLDPHLEHVRSRLAGQNVALIGNAQRLVENPNPRIARHDVIIRINKGYLVAKKTGCGRTDMLVVSAFPNDVPEFLQMVPFVTYMSPKKRDLIDPSYKNRIAYYPIDWWKELNERLGERPSTGCMAIDMLSRLIDNGELHLYGFDFWRSPTSYNGINRPGPHSPNEEEAYANCMVGARNIH